MLTADVSTTFSSKVGRFLADRPLKLFIGGEWRDAQGGGKFAVADPGTGNILTEVCAASADDVNAAVEAARTAFKKRNWSDLQPNERGVFLHRLADLVERDADVLVELESLDVGKPLGQARGDIANFSATLRYYTDLSLHIAYSSPIAVAHHEARVRKHPYGVCGFIFPWNFPFLLVGWGVSPALAAGNTVVIKPAEDTPLSTLYLAQLVKEAGIPDGVVNIISGIGRTAGAALAQHPGLNRMSFTGSPEVGRSVGESCGRNLVPVKLELGGKGAAVIFGDVSPEQVADKLVRAVTLNTGQVCCTATRWLVQDSIYKEFCDKSAELMAGVKIGYARDPNTQMGPVVSKKQQERVLGYVRKGSESADVIVQGGADVVDGFPNGFYVKPALLAGSPDNIAAREEIFGPVAFVIKFRDEAEAIEIVNSSPYGLANSVWSTDLDRADRVSERLVAGNSWINAHNVFVHGVPYGGVNLSGLGGGVLGPSTLTDYLRDQSIVRPL